MALKLNTLANQATQNSFRQYRTFISIIFHPTFHVWWISRDKLWFSKRFSCHCFLTVHVNKMNFYIISSWWRRYTNGFFSRLLQTNTAPVRSKTNLKVKNVQSCISTASLCRCMIKETQNNVPGYMKLYLYMLTD